MCFNLTWMREYQDDSSSNAYHVTLTIRIYIWFGLISPENGGNFSCALTSPAHGMHPPVMRLSENAYLTTRANILFNCTLWQKYNISTMSTRVPKILSANEHFILFCVILVMFVAGVNHLFLVCWFIWKIILDILITWGNSWWVRNKMGCVNLAAKKRIVHKIWVRFCLLFLVIPSVLCEFLLTQCSPYMMTSSNGNIFRATGHLSPVNSPREGQWRGALMFSFHLRLNKRLSKQS